MNPIEVLQTHVADLQKCGFMRMAKMVNEAIDSLISNPLTNLYSILDKIPLEDLGVYIEQRMMKDKKPEHTQSVSLILPDGNGGFIHPPKKVVESIAQDCDVCGGKGMFYDKQNPNAKPKQCEECGGSGVKTVTMKG